MYSFLIGIGILMIFLGFYFDKQDTSPKRDTAIEDINQRLQNLEDILFNYEPTFDAAEEDMSFKNVLDSVDINKEQEKDNIDNRLETFDVVSRLESGEYTIEQACKILNMKKGELLFLRNIYKEYRQ
jgi:hypothetical protein